LPDNDLGLIADAVRAAGQLALTYWRRNPRSHLKADGSPVSEADIAVNDLLRDRLLSARPGYGWLSEESPDDPARLSARAVFILDPIDGTRAFLDGRSQFAHSVAVVRDGIVTAAAVHLPAEDLLYLAERDGPARLNDAPIAVSAATGLEGASVLTSAAAQKPEHWTDPAPSFTRVFRPSLAWRLCLVAEGRFDAVLSLRPAWEWDIAAGLLIAERAGATATAATGAPIRFNAPDARTEGLIVAPPPVWAQVRARLRTPVVPPPDSAAAARRG